MLLKGVIMLFKELDIMKPILRSLLEKGYEQPTPIQEQSIPVLLEGRDILGCAQTGTGKTASFAIPVIQQIALKHSNPHEKKKIRALILAPTRELAIQIQENFTSYAKYVHVKNTVIFGGVPQNAQVRALSQGIEILIATPGRLLDLIHQKYINLSDVEHFVLDEADRMFDMGMVNDVKKIVAMLPQKRQNLLFSATMPKEVMNLVNSILKDPVKVEIAPQSSTVDTVEQKLYYVNKRDKKTLLAHILKDEEINSLLVFSRTKHGANNIVKELNKAGIDSLAIHGNKSQNARQAALRSFKEGRIRVLVATDIAARGIDVNELSHVVNYDLPDVPETYVHRIGRTGRAGHSGIAISFCAGDEKKELKAIEKVIDMKIPVMDDVNLPPLEEVIETKQTKNFRFKGNNNRRGNNNKDKSGSSSKRSSNSRRYNKKRSNKTV